jgi:hypothetical protein
MWNWLSVPYEGCICTTGDRGNVVSIDSLIFYFLMFLVDVNSSRSTLKGVCVVGSVGCMRYAILCW